jgi:ArsR family transcriptional regulator, arsenate/arsenite/antimonite-responsive transcriptional repressor
MAVDRGVRDLPLITADDGLCGPPITDVPLSEGDAAALAAVLAALADPVRLRLISLVASQGEVCSCHLEEPLGKSQPTISHHTRVLAEAGLIEGDKRGKWTWWRIVPGRLAAVRQALGGT